MPTPIGYGTPAPVTFIPESDEITPNWLCVFMRRTFVVTNPAAVANATLSINIDDGSGYCKYDFLDVYDDGDQTISTDNNVCELDEFNFTD